MKILICTGIYPPDIGGPAEYAKNIVEELESRGHEIVVLSYGTEKKLPVGIRHLFYFFKILPEMISADFIIALDTFSVGLPAVLAARIINKKIIVRVAGDFLWENYIENGGEMMALKDFYEQSPELSLKQKIIFNLSKYVFENASALAFSTDWQKQMVCKNYGIKNSNLFIVDNFFGEKIESLKPEAKNFIFAGRLVRLKNLEVLKRVFEDAQKINPEIRLDIISELSHEKLIGRIQACYAVILPSLSEDSPNFILDAIRADKPFIMTKETGFYDKFREIGLFIDPFDEGDIKEKILFLAEDKNYKKYKNKVSGFKFMHSWKQITDEFLIIAQKI